MKAFVKAKAIQRQGSLQPVSALIYIPISQIYGFKSLGGNMFEGFVEKEYLERIDKEKGYFSVEVVLTIVEVEALHQ